MGPPQHFPGLPQFLPELNFIKHSAHWLIQWITKTDPINGSLKVMIFIDGDSPAKCVQRFKSLFLWLFKLKSNFEKWTGDLSLFSLFLKNKIMYGPIKLTNSWGSMWCPEPSTGPLKLGLPRSWLINMKNSLILPHLTATHN